MGSAIDTTNTTMTRLILREKEAVVYLNKQIYSMEHVTDALTEASNHFTTQFTMQFSTNPKSYYIIKLTPKKMTKKRETKETKKDILNTEKVYAFCNCLLCEDVEEA